MIHDPTRHWAQNWSAFSCAAVPALVFCAIIGGTAGHANSIFRYGSTTDKVDTPAPSGSAAPAAAGSADLKTCDKGLVWDAKKKKCLLKRSGVLPDPELTQYAYALAKAERYQEAIEVLDMLDNPNTPEALNYRGYATRKLGHTDEGINYYLKSIALDPNYPQVREYLGEAYVIQGKFDLARDQLATIEKLCGSKTCENYVDLAAALEEAHAL
jgi:tetratricopeptide (TPR) repeat protein